MGFCDIYLIMSLIITWIIFLIWVSFLSHGFDKISFIKSECSRDLIKADDVIFALWMCGPVPNPFQRYSPHPSPFPHSHNSPLTHITCARAITSPSAFVSFAFLQLQCCKHDFHIMLYHFISVHNFHSLFALGRRVFRGCMIVIRNEVTRRANTVQQPMALSDSFVYLITGCWCIF